ncbi:Zn-dependent peptidase ImmA, M78 family [Micrococcales bacterium KH10]|nr:Zn-dependent peptidase ImmA, M78 family [Micrococcales bacterium KH10]
MRVVTMTWTSTSQRSDSRLEPSRIRLARERRGLSKVALAQVLNITPRALQNYETEGAPVTKAGEIAHALHVAPSFFTLEPIDMIDVEQGYFRARRRATARQLGSARAAASIGVELYTWIAERFRLPQVMVPDFDQHDPEQASSALRAFWGRGHEPLPNLIQLAEAHGIRVLSLPAGAETVDAFSLWLDGVPHVFLATHKTAERSRFDLAHEIGHLVLHSRVPADQGIDATYAKLIEKEADAFASAFLMPRESLLAHSGREPAVPQILHLRSHYKVSAMATTKRLADIGRLSEWNYRQNCVQLSQRGFRTSEPGGIPAERSRVFATVFTSLRGQHISVGQVAADLGILPDELHGLTFGQATYSIDGDRATTHAPRPHLRVVR